MADYSYGYYGFCSGCWGRKRYRKSAKILVPLLFLIIVILDIQAIILPGGKAGLEFLFKPKFNELTAEGLLAALGHAFSL